MPLPTVYGDPASLRSKLLAIQSSTRELQTDLAGYEDLLQQLALARAADRDALVASLDLPFSERAAVDGDPRWPVLQWQERASRGRLSAAIPRLVTRLNQTVNQFLAAGAVDYTVFMRVEFDERRSELPPYEFGPTLSRVASTVTALLEELPQPQPAPVEPRERFARLRMSGLVDAGQVDGYVELMARRRTKAQISAAIGAAKDLTEATYRAAAVLLGVEVDLTEFRKTGRNVRQELMGRPPMNRLTRRAAGVVSDLLQTFVTLDLHLGTVRNELGSGHGRATAPAGLKPYHAEVAIDVAEAQTNLILSMLQDASLL